MLIIAIRKFYFTGDSNEIERTGEEMGSISTTSETLAMTRTDSTTAIHAMSTVSNTTLTSYSSIPLGDQYMILILVFFLL